jgi:hypothetical protein
VQDEACTLFEEIEGQGSQLEQVVTTLKQRLEGSITKKLIQDFIKKEYLVKKKFKATLAKLKALEAVLPRFE